MRIIIRMQNDCLCWLFLVAVDIIRDKLPQETEMPFVWALYWVAVPRQVLCLFNHMTKNLIIWGPFYGSKNKHLFRMKLMLGNTENISRVSILTLPGMTSSLTSHGSVNDITRHFSLNSFLLLSVDTEHFHLKHRWKIVRANQYYGFFFFISINVSFGKTLPLKKFLWTFSHPDFIKTLWHLMYQMV